MIQLILQILLLIVSVLLFIAINKEYKKAKQRFKEISGIDYNDYTRNKKC
jgi:hypothetical protein